MLKLVFLLIGPEAFRAQWYVLALLGAALMGLAPLVVLDALNGRAGVTYGLIGLFFLGNGLVLLPPALVVGERAERRQRLLRAVLLLLAGGLMLASPFESDWVLSLLFALGLALDGVLRIIAGLVSHFPRWRQSIFLALLELLAAPLLLLQWPLSHAGNIMLGVALFLALSGWLLLRLGLMLRTLEEEVAILLLPLFGGRGWFEHAPVLVGADPPRPADMPPLNLHAWTPVGSAAVVQRRPLLDRYIAAVDADGIISTGHVSLEVKPDLYISHYPAVEIERSRDHFIHALDAGSGNDVQGRFIPSYDSEVAAWRPADAHVGLRNYNPRRLRAFWAGYRQDKTYNATNRNCSVVVAAALEAALEGVLAGRRPWLRLLRLLADPDLWLAALIRGRAESMTWTPGFALDYARVLARIVDRAEAPWIMRLAGFLRRLRDRRTVAAPPVSPTDEAMVP